MYFFAFSLHFTRFFACNKADKPLIFNHLYTQTAPLSIFNVFFVLIFTLACAHQRFRMHAFIPYARAHLFLTHARIYSLRMRARIYLRNARARVLFIRSARACDEHKWLLPIPYFLWVPCICRTIPVEFPQSSRRVPVEFPQSSYMRQQESIRCVP